MVRPVHCKPGEFYAPCASGYRVKNPE